MKRIIPAALMCAVLLCGCAGSDYKAKKLVQTNDENGWNCSFESMDGDFANGFKINSSSLRIQSSVEAGSMEIILSGNGQTDRYDGSDFDEILSAEKFGDNVLYITLSCEDAQNGRVRVVWCEDEEDTIESSSEE
ncbi:MAG: hypothetical protein ACI4K7_11450 [Oscillospiraceae bacterium]